MAIYTHGTTRIGDTAAELAADGHLYQKGEGARALDTGAEYIATRAVTFDGLSALPGGGGGDGLPLADPDGATTSTERNPIKDDDSTYTVLTLPADTVIFGVKLEGDAHPRLAFAVDPTNFGAIFMGDGTADPVNGDSPSASIYMSGGGGVAFSGAGAVLLGGHGAQLGGDLVFAGDNGTGPIIPSVDAGTHYRIVCDDEGVLSTVPLL